MRGGAKRKLSKPVSLAGGDSKLVGTSDKTIKNDHRTKDRLLNGLVAPIEVPNPEGPGKILVMRSLRDDPLGRLHDHKYIDDAQFKAGRLWQEYWEIIEIGGAKAIDFTKEAVDGGGFRDPFDAKHSKAVKELGRAARAVGILGERLLKDVLANRMFLNQVAAARNMSPEGVSKSLKAALEEISILWGFSMRSHGYPQDVVGRPLTAAG